MSPNFYFFLFLHFLWHDGFCLEYVYPCDSKIYCQGPILKAVHDANLFSKDNKDFVDSPLKKSPEETLVEFNRIFSGNNASSFDPHQLEKFYDDYFTKPGSELQDYDLTDWQADPPTLANISDTAYRTWSIVLHLKWTKLFKGIKEEVKNSPSRFSLIYLPNPFVVPGSRFREIYYWDAFWMLRGLYHGRLFQTARGMVENYLFLVEKYGFIPNGGRVYYMQRSQLPFLAKMMDDYYEFTKNATFIKANVYTLERELLNFWENNRTLTIEMDGGRKYRVFHFNTPTNVPRPESYKHDVENAINLPPEDEANLFSNMASSAESGWDFSSRWFQDKRNIRLDKTRLILPVDLNALMCGNYKILSKFFGLLGYKNRSKHYSDKHESYKRTVMKIFYNESMGAWFDYHLDTQLHNLDFFASNLSPLFADCYEFENKSEAMEKILLYLKDSKALEQGDGLPTSMEYTGQQWDWPNAWANLVHMVVEGLYLTGDSKLKAVATLIAEHWTRYNYQTYSRTKHMYEKYDIVGQKTGFGGEYEVQEGFGWTNGVILDFLVKYGQFFGPSHQLTNKETLSKHVERFLGMKF